MKLTVISHTKHLNQGGRVIGWGPTVRELNYLLSVFDEVVHVAPLYKNIEPDGLLPYVSGITFIPLPVAEGGNFQKRIKALLRGIEISKIVLNQVKNSDYFTFRAPTGMGVYLIPLLLLSSKKGWFKYAGNWVQKDPPLSYRIQRFLLKYLTKNRKVTINGEWLGQTSQFTSFINPCLTDSELAEGLITINEKSHTGKLSYLFVGRVEKRKGIYSFLNAITSFLKSNPSRIESVYIVGMGSDFDDVKNLYRHDKIVYLGGVNRDDLVKYYQRSHYFVLPSTASEGFPKVLAEAACYGCIPITSNISSITQYITPEMGYILNTNDLDNNLRSVLGITMENRSDQSERLEKLHQLSQNFSYTNYNKAIKRLIKEC